MATLFPGINGITNAEGWVQPVCVRVLGSEDSQALPNGVVITYGRFSLPKVEKIYVNTTHRLALDDERKGLILVVDVDLNNKEATFCGRFSRA